jgi:hypothetical protein
MDLKKLIAKMDQIESKKVLTESEDKEATWTDMKGKPAKGKNKKYGNQSKPTEVDSEGKEKKKVEEGLRIAKALLEAFGLPEAVAGNPWAGSDPAKAAAWAALTPEDQQWLGGADPTDQNILARAPNKGAKINTAADQADADMGAAMKASAAQAAQPTSLDPFAGVDPNAIKAANASATTVAAGQPAKAAAKPDPKVQALQQKLIAAGAKIKADGIMGPQTQAAMKQFPQTGTTQSGAIGAQAALRKADASAAGNTAASGQPSSADLAATRKRMQELLAKANAQ